VFVVCCACCFQAPSPLAPWGHGGVPSGCYIGPTVGTTCGVQAARAHAPGEPVGELGVRWAGPIAMAKPGPRN
jgi:hypothetical protein